MEIGKVYTIKRCEAVIAWFQVERDRDFCVDEMRTREPAGVFTVEYRECPDICGIENPQR